tara:strand:+ start:314633 stop:315382 length:750 start_codon:yes stop_codon:yes gene_type:complete
MDNFSNNDREFVQYSNAGQTRAVAKDFVSNVLMLMSLGLMVSGALAYLTSVSEPLLNLMYNTDPEGYITGNSIFGWIVMLAPLAMVFGLRAGLRKFNAPTLTLLFLVFSALMGLSLSSIFLIYSLSSISITFFISAGMFGVMAIAGYTTKTDLTKMGSLLFMGLIGIIIASLVNMFLGSSQLDYIISFIGVLVFTGLTAYDMQKVKQIGMSVEAGSEEAKKLAVTGALSLYLDFINLFLMLLRFFGNRD